MSIVVVTGAIAPYTNRLYNAVGAALERPLAVLTCSAIEPQRQWSMPQAASYELKTLPGLRLHRSYTSHFYFNPSVIGEIVRRRPQAVLLSGFSPTMVLAGLFAVARGIPIAIMTDGSVETDPGAHSWIHRRMRHLLVPRATFGICASSDSARLLELYGLPRSRSTIVPIVSAWDGPARVPTFEERPFDLHFCGSIDEHRKGVLFFTEVVEELARRGRPPRVRISGDGPLKGEVERRLAAAGVVAQFDGYLRQDQLAEAYGSAKIFCFPSREEPWGLVANEAILCGTPVIASTHTTSGRELVGPFGAGIVRPLDRDSWVKDISDLLDNRSRWQGFQDRHRDAGRWFSLERSRAAFLTALSGALDGAGKGRARRTGLLPARPSPRT
ncbi:MAG: glycosyltransferase [Rhizobiales bacterium]|nr:glycosyltransferase [Hyphomicrobiales bacterium]